MLAEEYKLYQLYPAAVRAEESHNVCTAESAVRVQAFDRTLLRQITIDYLIPGMKN